MNSGNSGSFESSSGGGSGGNGGNGGGGNDEYESRTISGLINTTTQPPPPPCPHGKNSSSSTMFDPLSTFFDPMSNPNSLNTSSNPLLDLDMTWSKSTRSDDMMINPLLPSSSPPFQPTHFPSEHPFPPLLTENTPIIVPDQTQVVVRNSKKRSRASRRAPTTVLTTDTSNFRAMVQEFTGIPAPPQFIPQSSFSTGRFDLFGTPPSAVRFNSDMNTNTISHQPLHRPLPQKLHQPTQFFPSSSNVNYPIPSMQIPYHQANTPQNPPIYGSKKQSFNQTLVSDQYGLGQGNFSGFAGVISSDQTSARTENNLGSIISLDQTPRNEHNVMNYSASGSSSSNFQSDKGIGNIGARSTTDQGIVEKWICSSSE